MAKRILIAFVGIERYPYDREGKEDFKVVCCSQVTDYDTPLWCESVILEFQDERKARRWYNDNRSNLKWYQRIWWVKDHGNGECPIHFVNRSLHPDWYDSKKASNRDCLLNHT